MRSSIGSHWHQTEALCTRISQFLYPSHSYIDSEAPRHTRRSAILLAVAQREFIMMDRIHELSKREKERR